MYEMSNDLYERKFYNSVYANHEDGRLCPVSCSVLAKARRNVKGVLKVFNVSSLRGASVLDIGCGLGFFSEALREHGAKVTAVDTSSAAVKFVKTTFPLIEVSVASFPAEIHHRQFDFIWANDFSMLNTFDADFICQEFIRPCLLLLKPGASLVIGWHSNFSGDMGSSNWANWAWPTINAMKEKSGLSDPRVVTAPTALVSDGIIRLAKFVGRHVPIYFQVVRSR